MNASSRVTDIFRYILKGDCSICEIHVLEKNMPTGSLEALNFQGEFHLKLRAFLFVKN